MATMKSKMLNSFTIELLNVDATNVDPIKNLTNTYPLVVIKNFFASSDEDLLAFSSQLSSNEGEITDKLLHWDFGPIMRMGYQKEAKNYLFSNESVPFHWDGAFYREPQKLVFFCEDSSGSGGETLFCNTNLIWNDLSADEKQSYEQIQLSYQTEKKAHYGGTITVNMKQEHPVSKEVILRYAEEVETKLNPVSLQILGLGKENTDEFKAKMKQKLYSPKYTYTHLWNPNDLVIADNFYLVHGRESLKNNTQRKFKRIQVL